MIDVELLLEPARTALLVQDLQNDLMAEGGATASGGAREHSESLGMIPKLGSLLSVARTAGALVVHIHYVVETGRPTLQRNAPLFRSIEEVDSVRRSSWGARAFSGVEPAPGDVVVEKMRMNGFYGTRLEPLLRGAGIDTIIVAGALTNLSIEHTSRHGADAGFRVIVPSDGTCSFDDEWHRAGLSYGLSLVADVVTCAEIERAMSNTAQVRELHGVNQ